MGKRIVCFFVAQTVVLTFLYFRVWKIIGEENLIDVGEQQNTYTLSMYSMRANIYDRNFEKMVNEEPLYASAVVPSQTDERFFEHFSYSSSKELSSLIAAGKPFLYTTDYDPSGASGAEVHRYFKRYSENQLAGHIIGYTDSSFVGAYGIEKAYNDYLKENGETLKISYSVNARGNFLEGTGVKKVTLGKSEAGIVLTIDKEIQKIAEEAGKTIKKGAIVIMDPYSGDILASASFPSLNLNDLSSAVDDPNSPFINRAFSHYSIGSVFKIVLCAAALENGMDENEIFECKGSIALADTSFRCHKLSGHGSLDMLSAVEQSCNPYFIELGRKLGFQKIYDIAEKLGFGKGTDFGNGLVSLSGNLPQKEDIKTVGDLANFSFGQGSLTATPVQLAAMVSAVVNDGNCPSPRLIKGFAEAVSGELQNENAIKTERAFSASTARKIQKLMISAVENGTGILALPTYGSAGGKTGSAETGQYSSDGTQILNALFCGFYPATDPKYSIVVLLEDGVSGSVSAGPIFKEICEMLYATGC